MRETELTYYFSHMDEFPLPALFEGCTQPFEVLAKVKPFLNALLADQAQTILGEQHEGVFLSGPVFVGKGTALHSGVVIEGPAWIGENCELMAGAYVRPYTILGNRCVVGHGCEVKHSVVQNGAKVQSFTFIGDCMIGRSARVGSGTILANRKFNQPHLDPRAAADAFRDPPGKALAIHRQRAACGHAGRVRRREDERIHPAQFFFKKADGVLQPVAPQGVAANQLGKVRIVVGGGEFFGLHLHQSHGHAALCQLPGRLAARKSRADDRDGSCFTHRFPPFSAFS